MIVLTQSESTAVSGITAPGHSIVPRQLDATPRFIVGDQVLDDPHHAPKKSTLLAATRRDLTPQEKAALGVENLATKVSDIQVPDGTGVPAGTGIVCTGLSRLPDLTWLIGNAGGVSGASSSTWQPSWLHTSADFQTVILEVPMRPLYSASRSVQGVTMRAADGTVWVASTVDTPPSVRHLSLSGTPLSGDMTNFVGRPNGLCDDPWNDQLIVSLENSTTIQWRSYEDGSVIRSITSPVSVDHIFLLDEDILLVTGSTNNRIRAISTVDGATLALITINGADAVEGPWAERVDGQLHMWIANDAYFHQAASNRNSILGYTAALI